MSCEYQLGKRNLYPSIGGTINQKAYGKINDKSKKRVFNFNDKLNLNKYDLIVSNPPYPYFLKIDQHQQNVSLSHFYLNYVGSF